MFSRSVVGDGVGVDRLTLATAVALCRAIDRVTAGRVNPSIKWPNDILIDQRKLAGILVESFSRGGTNAAIVGVGMNVAFDPTDLPPEVRDTATSLAACGVTVDRLRLLAETVRRMDACLAEPDMTGVVDEWRRRSTLLGKDIRVRSDSQTIEGHVIDLDPAVGLTLRTHDGELLHLHAATTTILPQPV
jgi:BirA family biotin operon repressor/biotin-[acetyl-CoA-carboxylase] ligase